MTEQINVLEQLLTLTNTLLEKALQDNWEEVFMLESTQRELVELLFNDEGVNPSDDKFSQGIKELILINEQVMRLGNQQKQKLATDLHKIDQGKKALTAYSL
ncbi:MAG: flagellar protein FliT [Methylococcaceae bacterium]|jgi:hypothetical protein|nr:flagellar protein FliT [Methylovulum sp.]